MKPDSTLVTIHRSIDRQSMHLYRGLLETNGIECFLQDDNLNSINIVTSLISGGIRLQVAKCDVNRARNILASIQSCSVRTEPPCPECGSKAVKMRGDFLAFLFYLFCSVVGRGRRLWRCTDCRYKWQDK